MGSPAYDDCIVSLGWIPLVDPYDHEGTAEDYYDRAALPVPFPPPRLLARRHGQRFRPDGSISTHSGGLLVAGVILYRPGPDRRVGVTFLHETAEAILARRQRLLGTPYHHGDVWRLTLALAAPVSSLRELTLTDGPVTLDSLYRAQRHVERKLLELRLQQLAALTDARLDVGCLPTKSIY